MLSKIPIQYKKLQKFDLLKKLFHLNHTFILDGEAKSKDIVLIDLKIETILLYESYINLEKIVSLRLFKVFCDFVKESFTEPINYLQEKMSSVSKFTGIEGEVESKISCLKTMVLSLVQYEIIEDNEYDDLFLASKQAFKYLTLLFSKISEGEEVNQEFKKLSMALTFIVGTSSLTKMDFDSDHLVPFLKLNIDHFSMMNSD